VENVYPARKVQTTPFGY